MKISNDQIIAMNTLLADHVVKGSELQSNDTDLVQYVARNIDPSIIQAAINTAEQHDLYCYVIEYDNMLKIISWPKNTAQQIAEWQESWDDFMQS